MRVVLAGALSMLAASASAQPVAVDKQTLFGRITAEDPTIVTRSHTVSLYVDSARFADLPDGTYAVQLKVRFEGWASGATAASNVAETRVIFSDLIQQAKREERVWVANHRKLIDNLSLSDKTSVTLELSLVPLDQDKQKVFGNVLQPLLGRAISFGPVNEMFDAFFSAPANPQVPVFETTLDVPLNTVEYKALAERGQALLKTDTQTVIVAQGVAAGPAPRGLVGALSKVVNTASYVINGKSVIKKTDDVKYSGVLGLYFTRSTNTLMPADILTQLTDVDNLVASMAQGSSSAELDAAISKLTKQAVDYLSKKQIGQGTYQSVVSYTNFAKAFALWRSNFQYEVPFKTALQDASTRGLNHGTKVYHVTGIYTAGDAPVAIPYSLPDEQITNIANWQIALHDAMKAKNDLSAQVARTPAR